ncbi:hypothetical protein PAXRUDRAFT_161140, partial [Paxillus rubicundulus Ve08.2h10]
DASDSDTSSVKVMAFSLMDDVHSTIGSVDSTDSDKSLEESDNEIICIGEKRQGQDDFEEALTLFEAEEPSDYAEQCARKAAAAAHRFWRDVMSSPAHTPSTTVMFLDTTEDDNDSPESVTVLETVKRLVVDAKKFKSFTSLFHLNALKQFIELWEKYQHNPRIRAPMLRASHCVTTSVGKGPYLA